jgi:hypothetical protein
VGSFARGLVMQSRNDECRKLHEATIEAFRKANALYETHPEVGSPEWIRYVDLLRTALAANDACNQAALQLPVTPTGPGMPAAVLMLAADGYRAPGRILT